MVKRWSVTLLFLVLIALALPLGFAGVFADEPYTLNLFDERGQHIADIQYVIPSSRIAALKFFHKNNSGDYYNRKQEKGSTKVQALDHIAPGLSAGLAEIVYSEYTPAADATVTFDPDGAEIFTYTADKNGKRAILDAVLDSAAKIVRGGGRLCLTYETLYPEVTQKSLLLATAKISEFSTDYADSSEPRKHNIQLAASFFHGVAVKPGETLSFNEVAKKRTEANGYRVSKVIENGEYTDGVGGGVCQVSTTVYNAWLYAGLSIEDSRSHTIPAKYVPVCADATVSDWIDLKMYNSSGVTVYILARADGKKVKFTLYGLKSQSEVRLMNTLVKEIPPQPNKKEGEGDYLVSSTPGKNGYVYNSYQCFYKNGVMVNKIKIRTTYYAPRQGVDVYSTDDPEAAMPEEELLPIEILP